MKNGNQKVEKLTAQDLNGALNLNIMKNISKLILGMVFVFGMTSMSGVNTIEAEKSTTKDCATAYTVCDNHAPDDYEHFASCMDSNGC